MNNRIGGNCVVMNNEELLNAKIKKAQYEVSREAMTEALVAYDIEDIKENLRNGDTQFLSAVLSGDGFTSYNNMDMAMLKSEFNEMIGMTADSMTAKIDASIRFCNVNEKLGISNNIIDDTIRLITDNFKDYIGESEAFFYTPDVHIKLEAIDNDGVYRDTSMLNVVDTFRVIIFGTDDYNETGGTNLCTDFGNTMMECEVC